MNLSFTQAHADEFDSIFAILLANAHWLESIAIRQWPVSWLEAQQDQLLKAVNAGQFYVLKNQGDIQAVVEVTQQPEALWDYEPTPALYLHKLASKRNSANRGLGQRMLSHLCDLAACLGINLIRLDCIATNLKLRSYYLTHGFHFCGLATANGIEFALYESTRPLQ